MALQRESKLVVIDTKMQQIFDLSSVKVTFKYSTDISLQLSNHVFTVTPYREMKDSGSLGWAVRWFHHTRVELPAEHLCGGRHRRDSFRFPPPKHHEAIQRFYGQVQ